MCVVTLGIGMAPVIGIQYGARVFTTPPPGVDTAHLVEVLTTSVGPHRATDKWSYPDFIGLRQAVTGLSITGWITGESRVTFPASGEVKTSQTMFVVRVETGPRPRAPCASSPCGIDRRT